MQIETDLLERSLHHQVPLVNAGNIGKEFNIHLEIPGCPEQKILK